MLPSKINTIAIVLSVLIFSLNSSVLYGADLDYISAQMCVQDKRSNFQAECYLQDYPHSVEITISRKKYTCLCEWMDDANMKKKINEAMEALKMNQDQATSTQSSGIKKRKETSTIAKLMQNI
ncbi:UNKNOWN [Stylonychia lemnae]|uniref:Uncharacterized protein n=1 Tax=Stylonychia lemnae TaxID=5949 RepID=A0A078A252_STYLE|nr:UNKNOWN [Stylonychia lemnae]|eukprot:CDW75578.1 UNKNOWN [Stylonychia lemnae]